eukprot:scaffold385_cov305-Pinguiococcus_pyrenoidosus.AAC.38
MAERCCANSGGTKSTASWRANRIGAGHDVTPHGRNVGQLKIVEAGASDPPRLVRVLLQCSRFCSNRMDSTSSARQSAPIQIAQSTRSSVPTHSRRHSPQSPCATASQRVIHRSCRSFHPSHFFAPNPRISPRQQRSPSQKWQHEPHQAHPPDVGARGRAPGRGAGQEAAPTRAAQAPDGGRQRQEGLRRPDPGAPPRLRAGQGQPAAWPVGLPAGRHSALRYVCVHVVLRVLRQAHPGLPGDGRSALPRAPVPAGLPRAELQAAAASLRQGPPGDRTGLVSRGAGGRQPAHVRQEPGQRYPGAQVLQRPQRRRAGQGVHPAGHAGHRQGRAAHPAPAI